jgi:hypothetical protein
VIKTVGLFELPSDIDAEEFWREHTVAHARNLAERAGDLLQGYVISRVRAPLAGEPKFWGMVELWFADEQARAEFDRVTSDSGLGDDETHFEEYVREFSAVEVEEHVVIRPDVTEARH